MTPWLTVPSLLLLLRLLECVEGLPTKKRPQELEDFLMRLDSAQNASVLLDSWINKPTLQKAYLKEDDGEDGERDVPLAEPAKCAPLLQVVEIDPKDPTILVWPHCTKILRCAGCCSSALLTCVPTRTSTIALKIMKARFAQPGAEWPEQAGYEIIHLEQHERCACVCKERATDCGSKQRYEAGECRCVCNNDSDSVKCESAAKFWDNKNCECKCRHETECSTGFYFCDKTCRCEREEGPVSERTMESSPHHISTFIRDDGEQSDTYRLRYDGHVGPFPTKPLA